MDYKKTCKWKLDWFIKSWNIYNNIYLIKKRLIISIKAGIWKVRYINILTKKWNDLSIFSDENKGVNFDNMKFKYYKKKNIFIVFVNRNICLENKYKYTNLIIIPINTNRYLFTFESYQFYIL